MKNYVIWLAAFVVLLIGIPMLISFNQVLFAKILGVVLVLSVTIAIRIWLNDSRKLKMKKDSFKLNTNQLYDLNTMSSWYKQLGMSNKKELNKQIGFILSNVSFDNLDHSDPEEQDLLLASLYLAKNEDEFLDLTKVFVLGREEIAELDSSYHYLNLSKAKEALN